MTLVFRTTDLAKWGSGKGSNLTPTEVDDDFWELLSRIIALEGDAGTAGVGIDHFAISGTQLTIYMTDATIAGPFTLPVAGFVFKGAWTPSTVYIAQNIVTNGGKTYLVLFNHTSAGSFDPAATDGLGHNFYGVLFASPDPIFDISASIGGRISAGGASLLTIVAARAFNLPTGLTDSNAYLRVGASTQDVTIAIFKNSTQIGTVLFAAGVGIDGTGGQPGVFTFSTLVAFSRGDRLSFFETTHTADATATDLAVTLAATVV